MIMTFKQAFQLYRHAQKGVSAVEFALIVPLILLIYFACVELSLLMVLDRKVTTSTSTLGDLTARAMTISNSELDDIFEATRMIFQPNDMSDARMRVSSLYNNGGTVQVRWSESCNTTAYSANQVVTAPANLVPEGGSIILAEIEYDYNSALGYFFTTTKTLSDKFYLRPRRVDEVTREQEDGFTCAL